MISIYKQINVRLYFLKLNNFLFDIYIFFSLSKVKKLFRCILFDYIFIYKYVIIANSIYNIIMKT